MALLHVLGIFILVVLGLCILTYAAAWAMLALSSGGRK